MTGSTSACKNQSQKVLVSRADLACSN